VFESAHILLYLAEKHGSKFLPPASDPAARVAGAYRLTFVHFSAQPEPVLVIESTGSVNFPAQPELYL